MSGLSISYILCSLLIYIYIYGFHLLFRWLEEIDRKQAELVATQIALEELRQHDRLLTTKNDMLMVLVPYF